MGGEAAGDGENCIEQWRHAMLFSGDPNAAVYHSESFGAIMGFVASNPNKFSVKQTDKALIVTVKGLETVFEALYVLGEWDTHRTAV